MTNEVSAGLSIRQPGGIAPEPNFTSWTKITDIVIDSADLGSGVNCTFMTIDEVTHVVVSYDIANLLMNSVGLDGTGSADSASANDISNPGFIPQQSLQGRYTYLYSGGNNLGAKIQVYKSGKSLQTINESGKFAGVGGTQNYISASGKYIAFFGPDAANSKRRHVIVYQGK